MKNTERFSDRVKNYEQFRPHYRLEIVSFLKEQIGLNSDWVIADIGSGTGISTEIFLKGGNLVYGVEPNEKMRVSAEVQFAKNKNFVSIDGTAEATSLPSGSVNLIVAAQAFHWFREKDVKTEFQRISSPEGYVALIWNERKSESPFQKGYEKLLQNFVSAEEKSNLNPIDKIAIDQLFFPNTSAFKSFSNAQYFDFEGLKGRLLSSSFVPKEADQRYKPMMRQLKGLFDQFSQNGLVTFAYNCKLYYGKIV